MIRLFCTTTILAMLATGCATSQSVSAAPGASPLYDYREIDMHLHCGLERQAPLNDWLDMAAKDGRKVILMVDHLELYRKTLAEHEAWLKEKGFPRWYEMGAAGHAALEADFDNAIATRKDLILFKGWEIYEGELDTGIEEAPMRMADCIGWHISPNNGRKAPDGESLIKRARQVKELQKQFPIPMILFHPFSMRVENLQRTAVAQGRDPKAITVEEYRFFQPGQQEELASILKDSSIYIEMGKTMGRLWNEPVVREALLLDSKPLVEMGVKFTVSTDHHYIPHAQTPFDPQRYCEDSGITRENVNVIVQELIDIRAGKRKIAGASE